MVAIFMIKLTLSIILTLFIHQAHAAMPAPNQTLNMCPTDKQHPSSPMLRQWAFVILQRAGYKNPHDVTLINAPSKLKATEETLHNACAHAIKKTIHFNERHYAQHPIGVKLATIGHEAIHIAQNYVPKDTFIESQAHERYADQEGLRLGACEKCGLEIAHYYLKEPTRVIHFANMPLPQNIQQLHDASGDLLQRYLTDAKSISARYYTTHPCGRERAYYQYQLTQTAALKGHMCTFHKTKRKIIIRSILKEAQRRKNNMSGHKRKRETERETETEAHAFTISEPSAFKKQK